MQENQAKKQQAAIKVGLDKPTGYFHSYLDELGVNKRIFFSGKFGSGKTYFLKEFFKNYENEYDTYHLYPIRYQVLANDNIVDFLRYDILAEILKKDPRAFHSQANTSEKIKKFFTNKEFMKEVVKVIPRIGRPLTEIIEIKNLFKELVNKSKSKVDELEVLISETCKIELDCELKLKIKEIADQGRNKKKKSVLILDDFDRIDPDHIFRILNMFSTETEDDSDNLFGFDYVIIVGDINNTKSIFYHRYGSGADFEGYFNKFYSSEPFKFNNQAAIREALPQIIKEIKCELGEELRRFSDYEEDVRRGLDILLGNLMGYELITIRQIYKPTNNVLSAFSAESIEKQKKEIRKRGIQFDYRAEDYILRVSLLFISEVCGGQEKFKENLKKIKESPKKDNLFDNYLGRWVVYNISLSDKDIKRMISDPEYRKTNTTGPGMRYKNIIDDSTQENVEKIHSQTCDALIELLAIIYS